MNPDTQLPSAWTGWYIAVSKFVQAICNYLSLAGPAKPDELGLAMVACNTAADVVGTESERVRVSRTLSRAERDAKKLAADVVLPFPDQRAWKVLWWRASAVTNAIRDPRITEEMEDSLVETPLPKSPTLREVPCWDPECGLLTARDKTKRYRLPAERQRTILSAFQEEGWPTRIDAPLPEGVVNKAVANLNNAMEEMPLVFEMDGTGEGIIWGWREPENEAEDAR